MMIIVIVMLVLLLLLLLMMAVVVEMRVGGGGEMSVGGGVVVVWVGLRRESVNRTRMRKKLNVVELRLTKRVDGRENCREEETEC